MPSDDSSNNNPPAPPAAPSVAASQQNPAHINPWIIAIAVMLSTFMEVLDTTVVNVSLPHIAGSLSATVDEATWTLTSYLVRTPSSFRSLDGSPIISAANACS